MSLSCPICVEKFRNSDDIYTTLCGHIYHYHCMQQWQSRASSCPQCRTVNPQTHKIYLNFDEACDSNDKWTEMKSSLEQSILNSSCIQNQLDQSEREVMNLITVYSEKIFELNQEIENKNACIENLEQELLAKTTELQNLQGREVDPSAAGNNTDDELQAVHDELAQLRKQNHELKQKLKNDPTTKNLNEYVKLLDGRVKQLSRELENEKRSFASFTVDNLKLQAMHAGPFLPPNPLTALPYLRLSNMPGAIGPRSNAGDRFLPGANIKKKNKPSTSNTGTKAVAGAAAATTAAIKPKPKDGEASELEETAASKTTATTQDTTSVVIKGILKTDCDDMERFVFKLCRKMNLKFTVSDVKKISMLEKGFYKRYQIDPQSLTLVVQFNTVEQKDMFIASKDKLAADEDESISALTIYEFKPQFVNVLFNYAKELKQWGYKNIYCKNHAVFVKKGYNGQSIKINSKKQIDDIIQMEKAQK